jgi:hypothetical protein
MSLPRSQPVPTFAEHAHALQAALADVAENSFFGFTVPLDEASFADLARNPPVFDLDAPPAREPWVVTEVRFTGAFAGVVEIAMNESLARQLLQAFLGLGPDDPIEDAQLFDSTGEFANQVCGTWLTRACEDRRFDLQPPVVVRQALAWLPLDTVPQGGNVGQVLMSMNDLPLRVRITFLTEPA